MYNNSNDSIKFKKLMHGDEGFFMSDGIKLMPRASIEISPLCPTSTSLAIQRALADGHLKSVAYVREKDFVWEKLGG